MSKDVLDADSVILGGGAGLTAAALLGQAALSVCLTVLCRGGGDARRDWTKPLPLQVRCRAANVRRGRFWPAINSTTCGLSAVILGKRFSAASAGLDEVAAPASSQIRR